MKLSLTGDYKMKSIYIPYTYWHLLLYIPVFLHNELNYKVKGTGILWYLGILKSQLSTTVSYPPSLCMWWNQIELKVWIAFTCQDSKTQSWIPGAMSQFLLFTGLYERCLLNWANKADSVCRHSFCLLWNLSVIFVVALTLGVVYLPRRNVGGVGAIKK